MIEIPVNPNFIRKVIVTENMTVNRVQIAIKWFQDHYLSLRTISLRPSLYNSYFNYVQKWREKRGMTPLDKQNHEQGVEKLTAYNVDIVRGSAKQAYDYYFEHYRMDEKSASYFGSNHKMPDIRIYDKNIELKNMEKRKKQKELDIAKEVFRKKIMKK